MQDNFGTRLDRDKRYDQILHLPHYPQNFTNQGGVLDFYCGDHSPLFTELDKQKFTFLILTTVRNPALEAEAGVKTVKFDSAG